jgi:hypothetical protein
VPFFRLVLELAATGSAIFGLLALAAETSLADDDALDLPARHVLSALLDDPKTPENTRVCRQLI